MWFLEPELFYMAPAILAKRLFDCTPNWRYRGNRHTPPRTRMRWKTPSSLETHTAKWQPTSPIDQSHNLCISMGVLVSCPAASCFERIQLCAAFPHHGYHKLYWESIDARVEIDWKGAHRRIYCCICRLSSTYLPLNRSQNPTGLTSPKVSKAVYWRQTVRLLTMIRAGLISMVYQQTVGMTTTGLKDSGAITLMGTDVERIVSNLRNIHEIWASVLEVGVAIWLLKREIWVSCIIPLIISLGNSSFESDILLPTADPVLRSRVSDGTSINQIRASPKAMDRACTRTIVSDLKHARQNEDGTNAWTRRYSVQTCLTVAANRDWNFIAIPKVAYMANCSM